MDGASSRATTVLRLDGDVDLITADYWKASGLALHEANPDAVLVIDMSAVEFFDAAGMGVIAYLYQVVSEDGEDLRIRGVSPRIARLLHIGRLDQFIEHAP